MALAFPDMTDETIGAEPDMIGILVTDMARSVAFYRLLGLSFPDGAEDSPHVETTLRGGLRLALDLQSMVEDFHPDAAPTGDGRMSLAFRLPSADAVDDAFTRVTAAGYGSVLKPFDAPWGQRYATVRDPDGTSLDLFAWT
ncbi:Glyoxalase/Bleomycin resistance protein/Dioxygenase superfamily protein [Pseudonocardia ammonioxydans]|uniref:Glyoxalase/Bleomycin resistance protein/Dioxygenase superfamily protein n=2 Tax=Pseudonocardia ammonioxydans TaxID=260086 RepID=A0A1I5EFS7_PSUAM|nr:Glyoxalase/Bleomycin resistance protein/Dioxygenase superfamily protein [Pseudonocardia ammonioxydans]